MSTCKIPQVLRLVCVFLTWGRHFSMSQYYTGSTRDGSSIWCHLRAIASMTPLLWLVNSEMNITYQLLGAYSSQSGDCRDVYIMSFYCLMHAGREAFMCVLRHALKGDSVWGAGASCEMAVGTLTLPMLKLISSKAQESNFI